MPERLPETEEGRGMCRGKLQRVRQRNPEQANAISTRARHIENRPGERAIVPHATTLMCGDAAPGQVETGTASADGRHRIAHEHGMAEATQGKAEHGGIDVHTV